MGEMYRIAARTSDSRSAIFKTAVVTELVLLMTTMAIPQKYRNKFRFCIKKSEWKYFLLYTI